jgi:transcriptional regulator with XRE-family HTH domain
MSLAEMELVEAERSLDWARETLDLSMEELGQMLGTTRRTVQRWRARESMPSSEHREKLDEIGELRFWIETVFDGNQDSAQRWLTTHLPSLRGQTPIAQIRKGRIRKIIGILAAFESGAFI